MARVAVVTGGGRGIGAAVARLAAADGWQVAVNYVAHRARAEQVVAAIEQSGGRAVAVQGDVAQEADVIRLFEAAEHALGPVTALVNNAGVITAYGPVAELSAAAIRQNFEVNVVGCLLCAREAVRRMSRARGGTGGVIVNLASRAASMGMPGEYVHYAAAKGAILSLTTGLSREVIGEGIRVNSVSPGTIDTEMQMPGRVQRVGPTVPIGRAGTADEVAEAVVWLMSDKASYVTGADILVTGGR